MEILKWYFIFSAIVFSQMKNMSESRNKYNEPTVENYDCSCIAKKLEKKIYDAYRFPEPH